MSDEERDVPQSMLSRQPNWLVWRWAREDGRIYLNPVTGERIQNHHLPMGTLSEAKEFIANHPDLVDGFALLIRESDPYTYVRLKNCVNPTDGISRWGRRIIERADTYAKVDGCDVAMLFHGNVPVVQNERIEIQHEGYFLLTENSHHGSLDNLSIFDVKILELLQEERS